jgi:hypothetical protein
VVPSLQVDYEDTRIKQYHKEGRALRTETTINDRRDFGIGKQLLKNLSELRRVGFQANRHLLEVQTMSHDCSIGEDAFESLSLLAQLLGLDPTQYPAGTTYDLRRLRLHGLIQRIPKRGQAHRPEDRPVLFPHLRAAPLAKTRGDHVLT